MTRVLVFGTYDLLHKGHEYHLTKAASYGDELCVIIARDSTVEHLKGKRPDHSEDERKKRVEKLSYVTQAVLGSTADKYEMILKLKPDVICLGYDQYSFTEGLRKELMNRGISCKIVRFRKALNPEKYKTSRIRANQV
jgi:FAD synthetase